MNSTPIVLNANAVSKLLPQVDVLAQMRALFTELGNAQAVQPGQTLTLFPEDKGDFITYQGAMTAAGVFGAKVSPYLITEASPIITAWTLLMSTVTGQPLCLLDAGSLTTERTAATTALAVDFLAGEDAKRIAIIGSSAVAQAHWRHTAKLRAWDDVRVYSPTLASDADRLAQWKELCPDAAIAGSASEAVRDADVVMLCTSSGSPVIDTDDLAPHALVTSISTNAPQAHEVAPDFITKAQVYCDYRETTPTTATEMVIAARDHSWSVDQVRGDLAELSVGSCETPDGSAPVFFRSVGLGLEDIAIANAIYRAATEE